MLFSDEGNCSQTIPEQGRVREKYEIEQGVSTGCCKSPRILKIWINEGLKSPRISATRSCPNANLGSAKAKREIVTVADQVCTVKGPIVLVFTPWCYFFVICPCSDGTRSGWQVTHIMTKLCWKGVHARHNGSAVNDFVTLVRTYIFNWEFTSTGDV